MNEKATMTVREVSALLGISPDSVRCGIDTGALPIGVVIPMKRKVYVIYRSAVEALTGKGRTDGRAEETGEGEVATEGEHQVASADKGEHHTD